MTKLEPWAVATARAAIENGKARDSGKVHVGLPFSEKVMHHLGMTENMKQPPTKLEQIWLHKPRTMGIQRIRLLGGELKKQRPRFDWERRVNNAGKPSFQARKPGFPLGKPSFPLICNGFFLQMGVFEYPTCQKN